MTTLETRQQPETAAPQAAEPRVRRSPVLVLVAAIALGLGLFGGWLIWGSTESDADANAVVVVGGGELTQRQEEMIEMLDAYGVAYLGNDGAAVVEMYAENGSMSGLGNPVLRADDGTLENFVNEFSFPDGPF